MTYNMNLEENVYEKPVQHYELNDPETYAAARCHANALYDAALAGKHMKLPQAQVVLCLYACREPARVEKSLKFRRKITMRTKNNSQVSVENNLQISREDLEHQRRGANGMSHHLFLIHAATEELVVQDVKKLMWAMRIKPSAWNWMALQDLLFL